MEKKEDSLCSNQKIVELLVNYQWVYNFRVTDFFIEKPWIHIPEQWKKVLTGLTTEEMNSLPFGYVKDDWPLDLKEFVITASELTLPRNISEEIKPCTLATHVKRGMNPKKLHEVCHISALINDIATKTGCDVVIDVGSGLGYLGHVLTTVYGFNVIGLESKQCHTSGADKRSFSDNYGKIINATFEMEETTESIVEFKKLLSSCFEKFREKKLDIENKQNFCNHEFDTYIDDHSSDSSPINGENQKKQTDEKETRTDINRTKSYPENSINNSERTTSSPGSDVTGTVAHAYRCLLVGLHCCGDLTPAMLRVYSQVDSVRGLCCVSCCYHRMTKREEKYRHFPMSREVGSVMSGRGLVPTVPFLRLAAQETRERWKTQSEESHQSHVKAVAYRALLELYAHKENLEFSKLFRRIATAGDFEDFSSYLEKTLSRCQFSSTQDKESTITKVGALYEEYKEFFPFVEVITVLQVILQPLIERLVIQDRLLWLQENGLSSYMISVFDDVISPRNIALCSNKSS